MSYIFTKGATSQAIELYIIDSTDGTPETGVVFNTAGIDLKYRRKDAAVVSITEADLTSPALTDTWETGGFLEIGNGVYRLDLPDAALASAAGIDRVVVFGTVTGMVVLPVTIHLTAVDLSDVVRAGLTALPNAVVDAAGGLVISDAGGLDIDATNTAVLAIEVGTITNAAGADVATDVKAVKAETVLILADTDDIGVAGVGLTEAGGDGDHLTEAGSDGDHLTAINLPNQTMNIIGDITGNLSGSVGSLTGHTVQTADHTAGIADIPTVAEFEARTIVSADYVVVGDTLARVTLADTVTTYTGNTPQTADNNTLLTAIDTLTKAAGDGDLAAIKVILDALTAAGAAKLALGATTMITGIVSWDNTNATTTVIYSSDIIEATADHFNGRLFVPTSGVLVGQYTDITDYALDTGEGKFTVTAMTEPPADNTTFVIL